MEGLFVGRSTFDMVYACKEFPEEDTKVDAYHSYVSAGGPALNAAITFSALGGSASLYSEIGVGVFAEEVKAELAKFDVALCDTASDQQHVLPATTTILHRGTRTIVSQAVTPAGHGNFEGRISPVRASIVLSDGNLPRLSKPILHWAKESKITTVLDGGSWKGWTEQLLTLIDVAIVSSRFLPPGISNTADCLSWLAHRGIQYVAATNGPEPIRWLCQGRSGEIEPPTVDAVDTLGAGDVLHGAFCYYFSAGDDFILSLERAATVATQACTTWGPRGRAASRDR